MRRIVRLTVLGILLALTASPFQWAEAETRLNNFVTELGRWKAATGAVSFTIPRAGWVYVGITGAGSRGGAAVLAAEEGGVSHSIRLATEPAECMRWLDPGSYVISLDGNVPPSVSVVVRAIPEMHFCRYPVSVKIPEFGPVDWAFLEKYVLPNVNTIIGNPAEDITPLITKWTGEGKKWLGYFGLPRQDGLTGQQAFEYWSRHAGFQDPLLSGLVADEFSGRQNPWYPAWIEGMKMLGASEAARGRAFYGYCGGPGMYTRPQTREMVRTIFENGFYMAYERYHHEEPTLQEMQALMDRLLGRELPKWREIFPGCQRQLVMVLGLFAQGMGLNVRPDVDFKVHMDLQMQYLARHPAFEDLFGLHWWVADYADDELLKWLGCLYRHYGIEGGTELLSRRYGYEYELKHIKNPDFFEGFDGWEIEPAEEGSMGTDYMEYLACLEGRYWHRAGFPDEPAGNTYLWMQRQSEWPNLARQHMRGLKPDSLYSVKMISADYNDISQGISAEKKHHVALRVTDADVIAEKSFQATYSSQTHEPFSEKPAWFNLHRVVFRPKGDTAVLTITDWPESTPPDNNNRARVMVNFIEVQPYFDPAG